jgi:para-aminobenzoate synthetase component 1
MRHKSTVVGGGEAVAVAVAVVGGRIYRELIELSSDLAVLDREGFWITVLPYDGEPLFARFAKSEPYVPGDAGEQLVDPNWSSSLSLSEYENAVGFIHDAIGAGDVYEVNLCRVLSTQIEKPYDLSLLASRVASKHPAQYFSWIQIPEVNTYILSASPECFVSRKGRLIKSRPIKGSVAPGGDFLEKDYAENIMIVDLVRNDFGRVCEWGSVHTPEICVREQHPGIDHLVSTVTGQLREGTTWREIIDATFRPGSVTGAPKIAACSIIEKLEPASRGPYCGAIGWVDATNRTAELGVAIRTFWIADGNLCYGTGGAITWDSEVQGEWHETELKASRLLSLV